MIQSQFTRKMKPLVLAAVVFGGMLTNSIVQSRKGITTEACPDTTVSIKNKEKPLAERNGLWGTLFVLSSLGIATCSILGKAVDVRYKDGHKVIDNIFDTANITEKDLQIAFEESCREKDELGIEYDKEELRAQYENHSEAIQDMISTSGYRITGVTLNCSKDKAITNQIQCLLEELKSAVKYGYPIENEDTKVRLHYYFDKATTSSKKWTEKDLEYKQKYPQVDFTEYGVQRYKNSEYLPEFSPAFYQVYGKGNDYIPKNESTKELALKQLKGVKEALETTRDGEFFNKYDKRACLEYTNQALDKLINEGILDETLLKKINRIYNFRAMYR